MIFNGLPSALVKIKEKPTKQQEKKTNKHSNKTHTGSKTQHNLPSPKS